MFRRNSCSRNCMEAVCLKLIPELDQTIVKISVSEHRNRYRKRPVSLKRSLHIREHLVRDTARIDRSAEECKVFLIKTYNTFPVFRKCKVNRSHRHTQALCRPLRHRCDDLFRVSCRAEINRPYFCDLHIPCSSNP